MINFPDRQNIKARLCLVFNDDGNFFCIIIQFIYLIIINFYLIDKILRHVYVSYLIRMVIFCLIK